MTQRLLQWLREKPALLFGILVLVLSYFTFFHQYWYPPALFWDENYHIAAAQKYLSGVYFMEPHPPLGKLLIALGEKLLSPNVVTDQFIGTDYGKSLPEGTSFAGYRLFPALLAWFTAPVLFGIFLLLTRKALFATLLSFLYVFDNALIVHNRSAMLDGTQIFFVVLSLLSFLLILEWKERSRSFLLASLLFGASLGAAVTVKVNSLVLILLVPAILWRIYPDWNRISRFAALSLLGFLAVFVTVWQIHFALARTVNQNLPDQGYYQASEQYKQILREGRTWSPLAFPVMLRDAMRFLPHYERGVPRLDLCKDDENGSPFFFWPLGARTINYRWETPDGTHHRYLYLQVNPVIWWSNAAAVLLGIALLVVPLFFPMKEKLQHRFLLTVFIILYLAYLLAVARLDRVMYLYHYFLPLLFSFCILALVFMEVQRLGRWALTEERRTYLLLSFGFLIFLSFQFYRPLTYYEPISDEAFKKRAIFPLWELTCVNCEKWSMLVEPRK